MNETPTSGLALACACILSLAAVGCGQTSDAIDTTAGSADLRGRGGERHNDADGGSDRDKDVDELADEAVAPGGGAAGGNPWRDRDAAVDEDDDAEGGTDEMCRERGHGFDGPHRHNDGQRGGSRRGK
jgi:hypothetical protein